MIAVKSAQSSDVEVIRFYEVQVTCVCSYHQSRGRFASGPTRVYKFLDTKLITEDIYPLHCWYILYAPLLFRTNLLHA